jgi:hypothetical protein
MDKRLKPLYLICCCAAMAPAIALAQSTPGSQAPSASSTARLSAASAIADATNAITEQLHSEDPAAVGRGIEQIRGLLQSSPAKVLNLLRTNWLRRLIELQRYDDVLSLSQLEILAAPADTASVEQLQTDEVTALLATGKGPEALVAAKQLFNVSTLRGTSDAIRLVSQCLNAVHPGDRNMLKRYRSEQVDGARLDFSTAAAAPVILSSVKIDPAPYEPAIQAITAEDYRSLTGRGNLLLLAGNTQDAWDVLEQAYTMASDKELAAASESLARCMKAQDGTIGRANGWVLSIRPKAQTASERTVVSSIAATQSSHKE